MTAKVNRPHRKPGPTGSKGYKNALLAKPMIDNGMSIRQTAIHLGVDADNLGKNLRKYGLVNRNRPAPMRPAVKDPSQYLCPACDCVGQKAQGRRLCVPCYKDERKAICNSYYRRIRHPETKKYKIGKARVRTLIQVNNQFLLMPMRVSL